MKKIFLLTLFLLTLVKTFGQVGIGTTTPKANLDIIASDPANPSNTDGLLIPKVDVFPITNPTVNQHGMLVYLTTASGTNLAGFYYWDNSTVQWIPLSSKLSLADNDDDTKIQVEETVDEDVIRFDMGGTEYFSMNQGRFSVLNTGNSVFIGDGAGANDDLSNSNVYIGASAGENGTSANDGVAIGFESQKSVTNSAGNTTIGAYSGTSLAGGRQNTLLGYYTGADLTSGQRNIMIGRAAGQNATGSFNVFIGNSAGRYETANNKLYIENTGGTTPLIWGDFNTDDVIIYGALGIQGAYTFPETDGSANQFLSTDGAGNTTWSTLSTSTLLEDADQDTKIQVEESADEDIIRFYNGNTTNASTEYFRMYDGKLEVLNTGRSVFIGEGAGANDDLTNNYNSFIGYYSGNNTTTGADNTALGNLSLQNNTTGRNNTAIGSNALRENTTALANTAIGYNSLRDNITGNANVAIGSQTLQSAAATGNTAIGAYSMDGSVTGNNNTAIGGSTMRSNTSGRENVAIGRNSLNANTTGNNNASLGYNSLVSNTTGYQNVAIGSSSGSNSVGYGNVFLGNQSGMNETGNEKLYIENSNSTTPLIWGDFNTDDVIIYGALGVQGVYTFPETDGTVGQVLSTDGSGNVTWSNSTAGSNDQFADVFQLNGNNLELSLDNDGIATQTVDLSGFLDADNLGNHIATQNIETTNNWISNDGGNEGIYIDADGNVGVGTNLPTAPLEVTTTSIITEEPLFVLTAQSGRTMNILQPDITSNTDHFTFQTSNAYLFRVDATDVLTISSGKDVGIGTTNPTELLDVAGNATINQLNINSNYTFPTTDGASGQALTTDGTGNVSWSSSSIIIDNDGDTKIDVEESADEDIIRFDTAGTEYFTMNAGRLEVLNTGNSVFIGDDAGLNDDLSNANVFVGFRSGRDNTTGFSNTALGYEALAFGDGSDRNVAIGHSNSEDLTGGSNTSVGGWAMASAEDVEDNVAIGVSAFRYPEDGSIENVVIGKDALRGSTGINGQYDQMVVIGADACSSCGDLTNSIAIGYNTDATANNQARIGDTNVSSIGGYANWTNVSDGRFKKNIKEDIKGLDFIMRLRPVSYNLDMNKLASFKKTPDSLRTRTSELLKESEIQTGFIAQEVEQAAKESNFDFHGVDTPKNNDSHYGLRYAEFVVPIVKAMQEQQKVIEELRAKIDNKDTLTDKQELTEKRNNARDLKMEQQQDEINILKAELAEIKALLLKK